MYVTHFNKERKISGKFTCRFPVAATQADTLCLCPYSLPFCSVALLDYMLLAFSVLLLLAIQ